MFSFDFDSDGTEETFSFRLDMEKGTTTIFVGDKSITLKEGCDFLYATLIDLDPHSSRLNLLITIDTGSDDFVTIELHLKNGELKRGPKKDGDCRWNDGALWFYERTDIFGTATGKRTYSGDTLKPDSKWFTMAYIPTAKDLKKNRKSLIELGTLLHTVRPIPCTINGEQTELPEGTYLYRLRYNEKGTRMVVSTLDGVEATINLKCKDYEYRINGINADEYFDNVFYAD